MSIVGRTPFLTENRAAFISKSLAFIAFCVPTLLAAPLRPQPTFLVEVLLSLLLLLGLSVEPFSKRIPQPGLLVPAASLLFLCAVLLHGGDAWGYASCIILFVLAYCYGTASSEGIDRAVGYGLLLCAILQSFVVFIQLFPVGSVEWIPPLAAGRATGMVGHPNLLSDLLLFGLAALCHPVLYGRLLRWRLLVAVGLGLALAATGSRGAWLGIAVFCVIGILCRRAKEQNAGSSLVWIAVSAVLGQIVYALLQHSGLTRGVGAIARNGAQTSNDIRGYLAQISWEAIKGSPMFGQGAGSFWKVSVDAMQISPARGFSMLGEHAHNLPLNLAVEFGLPMSILICSLLLYWGWARLRSLNPERAWAMACVGVVFAHSMVEYPLWYTFLMVPCALCMGFVDAGRSVRLGQWSASCIRMAGLAGVLACFVMVMDWMHVRLAWLQLASAGDMTARVMSLSARDELDQVSKLSVFGQQVTSLRLQSYQVGMDDLQVALRDCEEHWEERPTWFMLKSCGEVFSAAGREDLLSRLVNVQCKGYPAQHEQLHDWALSYDASGKGLIKLVGRGCM
ncbi:O-antigen ligase family protein [Uliginosibacterium paludis]|uniref:Wzy polymerase domain-containing protein n=1 Tax=Uliginosibacterium paludis TaxID=1615952 RepID=A0ABV2CQ69_9RHOO